MTFSHPLARAAKIWQGTAMDGSKRDVLVVITTLELDPDSKKYKKDKVERLAAAAHCPASAPVRQIQGFEERRISGSS
jgi:hypothetical protein